MASNRLPQLLNNLEASEGDTFTYDSEAIRAELDRRAGDYSGWGVRVLSVVGGILACAFLLGFLFLAGLYDSPAGMAVLGFLFTAGSVGLNRAVRHPVLEAASISAYVAGYVLVGAGMGGMDVHTDTIVVVLALMAGATVLLSDSFMLLFLPVLLFTGCLSTLILLHREYALIHLPVLLAAGMYTGMSLAEPELEAGSSWMARRYAALRAGFLFSLLGLLTLLGQPTDLLPYYGYLWGVSSAIFLAAFLVMLRHIIRTTGLGGSRDEWLIYALGIGVLLPTALSPAVMGALLILVIGFHTSQPAAKVTGVLALLWSVSRYYYDLNLTLLAKSELLMASGAFYLLAYFLLQKRLKQHEPS